MLRHVRRSPPFGTSAQKWQRHTHVNTARLIELAGSTYAVPGPDGSCCGALHVHAGLHDGAVALAERTMASMPGSAPIVVNSAGCGAILKEYGHLLGTADAEAFSARVVDAAEWLATRTDRFPTPIGERPAVIVQDPCHLRHVQRTHQPTRTLLGHVAEVVELDDDGLCCGAGGAYSALQPELAGQIRDRKLAAIERARSSSSATVVASGNPGCAMHLAAALEDTRFEIRHPVDIVADALGVAG